MKAIRSLFMLFVSLLLSIPTQVAANNFENKYNALYFTVMPQESGCVHIKVLVVDAVSGDNNFWRNGTCYMMIGGQKIQVFRLKNNNAQSDNDDYANITVEAPADDVGVLVLTNPKNVPNDSLNGVKVSGALIKPTQTSYTMEKTKGKNANTAEFDFFYNPRFAGERVDFYVDIDVGNDDDVHDRKMSGCPVSFSSLPNTTVNDPVFMSSGSDLGYYSLIVSNTTGSPVRLDAVTEIVENGPNIDLTAQCKSDENGFSILIPSENYTREVLIEASIPFSPYIYYKMDSRTVTLNAFHNPVAFNLSSQWGNKGATVLKWTVPYPDDEDAIGIDRLAIERQLYDSDKPDSVDVWENIGYAFFEEGVSDYEFTDSTSGCYGDENFNSVRYRIYRLTTGKIDNFVGTTDMGNKRDQVSLGQIETVGATVNEEGNVLLTWKPLDRNNDGMKTFQFEDWHLRMVRYSQYYRGGESVGTVIEKDITTLLQTDEAGNSFYVDEGFAPCTSYSYSLAYYPNDPSGAVRRVEVPFTTADGDTISLEPVIDDSKIGHFKASDNTLQDRIHVEWSLDMERIDSIQVMRRLPGRGWEQMPIDPKLNYFEDYDVEAGMAIDYKISVSYECTDGMRTIESDAVKGMRRASGVIAGFVTFQDGTGLKDVEVLLFQNDTPLDTIYTDAAGSYRFPDVPYSDTPYVVRINSLITGFDHIQIPVIVDKYQPNNYEKNFISDGAFDVDGYVYFEQTTVPVYGATFLVDGEPVIDKAGRPVISDNDGHFAFKALKGAHRLEVQKEGHTFMFNGLYADNQGNAIGITEPRIGIFFWDQTKVRTIGRVVGGIDQGEKPVGFGLSKNNLGDNLRIVLELDGNQRSWLVKDQLDESIITRTETMVHEQTRDQLTNSVFTDRHRVVITPNSETGEYFADLLPTRYKVVEVSAQGYPSLFQKGKSSEVLDLTDSLTTKVSLSSAADGSESSVSYQALYNRIFRCEPTVTITEMDTRTGAPLPNIGLASYTERAGDNITNIDVPLYDAETHTYTFGYPVLFIGDHNFCIAATENYYYNGEQTGVCDSVPLRGGQIQVYDDFAALQHDTLCVLNEHTGAVVINVNVQNTVFDAAGTNALRHLDVTLKHDGQFIDGKSLRAFVMGSCKQEGDIVSADGQIQLVDVLRDPPGSRSYSWIDNQTTYHSQFHFNIGIDLSLKLGIEKGLLNNLMTGAYAGTPAGSFVGMQTRSYSTFAISPKQIPIAGYHHTYDGSVTFHLDERLQTSSDPAYVGDEGDIYYGYEMVAQTSAFRNVRAVNEYTYQTLNKNGLFNEEVGACHLIAEGTTPYGIKYYLISDYNFQIGPKIKSNFAYTQDYILNTLIPKLQTMRNACFYKGTRDEAQALADETLQNVLFSLRSEDDPRYAQTNLDDTLEYISIDRYDEYRDRLNYEVITPQYVKVLNLEKKMANQASAHDSIRILNRQIAQWQYIIALNEYCKVKSFATIDADMNQRGSIDYDAGTPYDVNGGKSYYSENHTISGGVAYSHEEQFSNYSSHDNVLPFFGWDFTDWSDEQGMNYFNKVANGAFSVIEDAANSSMGELGRQYSSKKGWTHFDSEVIVKDYSGAGGFLENDRKIFSGDDLKNPKKIADFANQGVNTNISVEAASTYTKVTFAPNIDLTWDVNSNESTTTNTVRGYVLQTDDRSHLSVDVYHDVMSVATGINVLGMTTGHKTISQGNYIFRTMGGTTKCPYDDGSVTTQYAPGTRMSYPTAHAELPRITVENHIISNVPYGEKAKFNLVLSNEGTVRNEGSFDLVLLDKTNQAGASLMMDGAPLGSGRSVVVPFGTGMVKVLEVGQGLTDDYENIRLALRSQCDPSVADTVSLSVHFVPSASPVSVISPQDKWVLNTNSAQDERGRYYMPVSIGGFDVNFRNFDHVELQYKQSTEPESRWTNLCSYYSTDSLFQLGSGTKAMLNGPVINHAFYGDSDPVELKYDLRAVTFSRLGNDFVTNASPVFSGIKDTRRPQLFGSPLPANGILGVGNDLKLVFSEPINANRLLATNNFRVIGLPNYSDLDPSTSVYVTSSNEDQPVLDSEASYRFDNENYTIDMMVKFDTENVPGDGAKLFSFILKESGQEITLSLGGNPVCLSFSGKQVDGGTRTVSSKSLSYVDWSQFHRIVVAASQATGGVRFYLDNTEVSGSDGTFSADYREDWTWRIGPRFTGNVIETRIWKKGLSFDEVVNTSGKTLSGTEIGLLAYYPMNEGTGKTIHDKVMGADLTMQNANWSLPGGASLRVHKDLPLPQLNFNPFSSLTDSKSYTLGFWFNAKEGENFPILSSGKADSQGNSNELFIGVRDGRLTIGQSQENRIVANRSFADEQWHQLTFVVDRPANLASAYVDGELIGQTRAADFGAPGKGNRFEIGGIDSDSDESPSGNMDGYIDEITLWDMAMPRNMVKQRMNESFDGTELGLLAYIPFSEQVNQISGGGTMMEPSLKYYFSKWDTDQQRYIPTSENAFTTKTAVETNRITDILYAPVKEKGKERNLRFDYVTKDNELLIDLKELPKDIEHTTVTITAMGIEDLNGNEMEQPVTWSAYIDRNMVRWAEVKKTVTIDAEQDGDHEFTLDINNLGGYRHNYTIEGLPNWLTIEEGTTGVLEPTESTTLHATVLKDINIGKYDLMLYLTNDDELTHTLALTIDKRGHAPDWTFEKGKLRNMQVCAQVLKDDYVVTSKQNIIGAFDEYDNCVGTAHIDINQQGKALLYLTVYPKVATSQPLTFRMWNASDGVIYRLMPDCDILYEADAIYGSYSDPVVMTATEERIQHIALCESWSWVSLNVKSPLSGNVSKLLAVGQWSNGDQLKDPENQTFYNYTNGQWNKSRTSSVDSLTCDRMYYILSHKEQTINVSGTSLTSEEERTMTICNGWNYIGYTPMINLPLNTALQDYSRHVRKGDIIKSQDEFAVYDSENGWQGNLHYMKPGQGYMLKHNADKEDEVVTFVYPYRTTADVADIARANAPAHRNTQPTTMNMIVQTAGIDVREGDRLLAYANGELRGIAEGTTLDSESPTFFLSVGGDRQESLTFILERNGELLGTAPSTIDYQTNALLGTTALPKVIDFTDISTMEDGVWYALNGICLGERRPTVKGVYILNKKKVLVK